MTLTKLLLVSLSLIALLAVDVASGTSPNQPVEEPMQTEANSEVISEEILSTSPMRTKLIVDARGLPAVVATHGTLEILESTEQQILTRQIYKTKTGAMTERQVLYLKSRQHGSGQQAFVAFEVSKNSRAFSVLSGKGILKAEAQPVNGGFGHLVVTLEHDGAILEVVLAPDSLRTQSGASEVVREPLTDEEREDLRQQQIKQR